MELIDELINAAQTFYDDARADENGAPARGSIAMPSSEMRGPTLPRTMTI